LTSFTSVPQGQVSRSERKERKRTYRKLDRYRKETGKAQMDRYYWPEDSCKDYLQKWELKNRDLYIV